MQCRSVWWFDSCEPAVIADFRRRALLALDVIPDPARTLVAGAERFGVHMAVGDLVVAENRDGHSLLIGEIDGAPVQRPGTHVMRMMRSVRWCCELPEIDCGQDLLATIHEAPPLSMLDAVWRAPIESLIAGHSANQAAKPLRFDIDCSPPAVALPDLPILYRSPYAERILRDFRWREYLLANPDVAATGDGEAHAFGHFFHQGYYERRIFDLKRLDGFDPGYYRERYPDLPLADDAEAQIHYCYQGWYEQRVPNRDSAWLHDADLHVFQMGKVGSHAISAALRDAGYDGRTIHLHWVTDLVAGYPSNRLPYSRILVHERAVPVKVISAVREIVSWALSGLFQYHGAATMNPADAVAMVEERFWEMCSNGLRWFDHRYFCDLDVYAHSFDHARGWTRIEHGGIDLLLYRQEDLQRLETPLAAFLDLPGCALTYCNVGDDKGYAGLYRQVFREFRLPGNLLSALYDSPYMRHFYSDTEREHAYARWARKD